MDAAQERFLEVGEEAIALLLDIENDMASGNSIVRYLLTKAKNAAVEALTEMATSDPENVARIKELQNDFNRFGDIRTWLVQAMVIGQQSHEIGQQMMSEEQAKQALQSAYVGGHEPNYED